MNYPCFDPLLLNFLTEHEIRFDYYEHMPVFTVEESESIKTAIPGKHSKNLFLTNKKDQYYLVSIEAHKRFPIKLFRKLLGCKELSFGSAEELKTQLNLTPGSVGLFGLIYASPERLKFFIDQDLRTTELAGRHPNRNDATITINHTNLAKFLETAGFPPTSIAFTEEHIEFV